MAELSVTPSHPEIVLSVRNGQAVASSRVIAEQFGKQHHHVVTKIAILDCSEAFSAANFCGSDYVDERGKTHRMYWLTQKGFDFLVMGFTGQRAAAYKEAYIEAFYEMADQLRGGSALPMLAQAVTEMRGQVQHLVTQQGTTDAMLKAVLDLVDVNKRYVALLENNQKPRKRATPYRFVTQEMELQAKELFAQGLSTSDVAMHLEIGRTTAHMLKHGTYSAFKPASWVQP